MFEAYYPNYEVWKNEFERHTINENTILVWHSCWWWFLVRWLSENKTIRPKKIILVAPWIDPKNEKNSDFFHFEIFDDIWNVTIFESTNDAPDIKESIKILKTKMKCLTIKTFQNYGHFCINDLWGETFSELLDEIL